MACGESAGAECAGGGVRAGGSCAGPRARVLAPTSAMRGPAARAPGARGGRLHCKAWVWDAAFPRPTMRGLRREVSHIPRHVCLCLGTPMPGRRRPRAPQGLAPARARRSARRRARCVQSQPGPGGRWRRARGPSSPKSQYRKSGWRRASAHEHAPRCSAGSAGRARGGAPRRTRERAAVPRRRRPAGGAGARLRHIIRNLGFLGGRPRRARTGARIHESRRRRNAAGAAK